LLGIIQLWAVNLSAVLRVGRNHVDYEVIESGGRKTPCPLVLPGFNNEGDMVVRVSEPIPEYRRKQ
jgi:hypothetical protein